MHKWGPWLQTILAQKSKHSCYCLNDTMSSRHKVELTISNEQKKKVITRFIFISTTGCVNYSGLLFSPHNAFPLRPILTALVPTTSRCYQCLHELFEPWHQSHALQENILRLYYVFQRFLWTTLRAAKLGQHDLWCPDVSRLSYLWEHRRLQTNQRSWLKATILSRNGKWAISMCRWRLRWKRWRKKKVISGPNCFFQVQNTTMVR